MLSTGEEQPTEYSPTGSCWDHKSVPEILRMFKAMFGNQEKAA